MSRIRSLLVLLLLALLGASVASANSVVKIRMDDTIQPITAEYIDRAIEHARQTNADAVLIELSTPGGLLDSTRAIIEKILASPVPVIVYVAPTRRARCLRGLLHPGIGRRGGDGSRHQYRRGASG